MEFKCKNCSKDKYRQINPFVKQCLFCGRNTFSLGTNSEDLDWTNEITENENSSFIPFTHEINYKELLKQMEDLMTFPMRGGWHVVDE